MRKTQVNVCDECKLRIAEKKCVICDCDICEECFDEGDYQSVLTDLGDNEGENFFEKDEGIVCSKCGQEIDLMVNGTGKLIKKVY